MKPTQIKSLATDFIMTLNDDDDEDIAITQALAKKHGSSLIVDDNDDDDDDDDKNEEEEVDDEPKKLPTKTASKKQSSKKPNGNSNSNSNSNSNKKSDENEDVNPDLEFEIDSESKSTNTWDLTTAKKIIKSADPLANFKSKTLDELISEKRVALKESRKNEKKELKKQLKKQESASASASAPMKVDGENKNNENKDDNNDEENEENDDDEDTMKVEDSGSDNDNDSESDSESDSDSEEEEENEDEEGDDADLSNNKSNDKDFLEKKRKEKLKESFFGEAPTNVMASRQFTEMNLSRPLLRAVSALNFASATEIQAATIPSALMGRDIVACAKTGSGKTAAFLLPIFERLLYRPRRVPVTRVLILSPTREIAVQCHAMGEKLAKYTDIKLCLVVGGFSEKKQEAELRLQPDIIIATPGRLIDHIHNTMSFDLEGIEILVMDEADRLLEMGFKEAIDEITTRCPTARQSMLFSATMTDEVEDLISLAMNKPVRLFVDKNTDTSVNLTQEFIRVRPQRQKDKEAMVLALCKRTFHNKTIVFFRSKQSAHKFKILFGLFGLRAAELHGDLQQIQRLESLEAFRDGTVDFLLATDLASRGLDIVGVETVINADMPNTLTQYIHRVGRTARAGRQGRSVSLVCEGERKLLKEIVKHSVVPLKSRVIPIDVIEKYAAKIKSLDEDYKELLQQEKEEKSLRQAEMEANKAHNMLTHQKEIFARPAKTWFQDAAAKKESKEKSKQSHGGGTSSAEAGALKAGRGQKRKNEDDDDVAAGHMQKRAARMLKGAKKGLRVGDVPVREKPLNNQNNTKKKNKSAASPVGFEKELTDTSKSSLRGLRKETDDFRKAGKKSSASGAASSKDKGKGKNFKKPAKNALKTKKQFKSSNRYKRR